MIRFTRRSLLTLAAGLFAAAQLAAQVGPPHFNDANQLVTDLASNPLNVNVYSAYKKTANGCTTAMGRILPSTW